MNAGNGSGRSRRVAKVTLKEVADAAGVSMMTVSNVIHNRVPVSPAVRKRVQEKIKELNYVPHRAAQALAGVARPQLGLLYPQVINSFIAAVIIGAMTAASRLQADVMVQLGALDDPEALRSTMYRMMDKGVDGFLLPSPIAEFVARAFKENPLEIPAVGIAVAMPFPGIATVRVDERQATLDLMSILLDLGHTRIGHLAGPQTQSGSIVRHEGYCEALKSRGIDPLPKYVISSAFNFHAGEQAAESLLRREPRVTAIFAANDTLAAGVIAAAHRLNITVPEALSVVGYDDSPIAEQVWPALTTVRQNAAEMTERAVEVLIESVLASKTGNVIAFAAQDIVFPYEIVYRSSVASVPQ